MPVAVAPAEIRFNAMRRLPNGSEYEKYSIAAALGFQSLSGSDKFTGQVHRPILHVRKYGSGSYALPSVRARLVRPRNIEIQL